MILGCCHAYDNWGPEQLLVIAPPIKLNPYYKEKFLDVIPFYLNYIDAVNGRDSVVLIADKETMPYYEKHIHHDQLILASIDDPWVRDVSFPIPSINAQFKYIGAGNKKMARNTQLIFNKFIHDLHIFPYQIPYFLDGGNLVNNNKDKVITTRKFLSDNHLTEEQGVEALKYWLPNVKNVSILTPDEPTLAHSDGMAAFVCENTIYMQKQEEPEHTMYKNELWKGCPGCDIIEVEGFLDERKYTGGYASSCGVYVNCVVTENYIYMPTFNHEKDAEALRLFRKNPCGKIVVPIDATPVCVMGGSLRCLSWQTMGYTAQKIKAEARASAVYRYGKNLFDEKKREKYHEKKENKKKYH